MNCTAEAPVPMTATRSPARAWLWSQCSEWKLAPAKRSRPGMSGTIGVPKGPVADTSTRAVRVPRLVSSTQCPASSSQRASRSSVPNRTRSGTPCSAATARR
jgi:hypothetical protein